MGEISVDKGKLGKGGYGLLHIIENRSIRDKLNKDEVTATVFKVSDAVKNGKITSEKIKGNGRTGIEKDGIIAIVSKIREGKDEKFIITGYALNEKKEEATEAIKTVIANYGYTPEFSDFRKQVGAVISSLEISRKPEEKSSIDQIRMPNAFEASSPRILPEVAAEMSDKWWREQMLQESEKGFELAKKAGYVQGVCECVAAIGDNHTLGKKLLSEMNVTKDMAKKFANPETYKALEQGIFAPQQKLEQTQSIKR